MLSGVDEFMNAHLALLSLHHENHTNVGEDRENKGVDGQSQQS